MSYCATLPAFKINLDLLGEGGVGHVIYYCLFVFVFFFPVFRLEKTMIVNSEYIIGTNDTFPRVLRIFKNQIMELLSQIHNISFCDHCV